MTAEYHQRGNPEVRSLEPLSRREQFRNFATVHGSVSNGKGIGASFSHLREFMKALQTTLVTYANFPAMSIGLAEYTMNNAAHFKVSEPYPSAIDYPEVLTLTRAESTTHWGVIPIDDPNNPYYLMRMWRFTTRGTLRVGIPIPRGFYVALSRDGSTLVYFAVINPEGETNAPEIVPKLNKKLELQLMHEVALAAKKFQGSNFKGFSCTPDEVAHIVEKYPTPKDHSTPRADEDLTANH